MCKHHQPPMMDADFVQQCEAFCAIDGKQLGLPLVMGTTTFGFGFTDMRDLCVGGTRDSDVMRFNDSDIGYCRSRSGALTSIETEAAAFVGAVEVFKAEQVALRAKMQARVNELQTELRSPEFQGEMDRAVDKMSVLRAKFQVFREQSAGGGQSATDFKDAIDQVKDSGESLKRVMDASLLQFSQFLTNCNEMFLGVGSQSEFLLDICSQANVACVDADQAEHVGCCCAVNPVTAGRGFQIAGAGGLAGLNLTSRVARRAAGAASVNVCAQARLDSASKVADAEQRVRSLGQEAMLQEQQQALAAAYSEYAAACGADRRLQQASGVETSRRTSGEAGRGANPSRGVRANEAEARRAAGCEPTADAETGLKVAITQRSQEAMCKHGIPLTDDEMFGECSKFCAPTGVPLLMGTTTYGFNLEEASSVCLPANNSDGVLEYNETHIATCEAHGRAFNDVEAKTAGLIEKLDTFIAAKLYYTAEMTKAVQDLQTFVRSESFNVEMDKSVDKMALFREAIKSRMVDALERSAGKQRLVSSMDALRNASEALKTSLEANLDKMRAFVEDCNDLYLATGPQKEFLLDICAQGNEACFENEASRRVSCCCALNPVANFGGGRRHRVDGISFFDLATMAAGRRAQETPAATEEEGVLDLCAEAWTRARPSVLATYTSIAGLGHEDKVEAHVGDMAQVYGSAYCDYRGREAVSSVVSGGVVPGLAAVIAAVALGVLL